MIVQFSGYNEGMRQLKDKSWRLTIETQELPGDTVAQLASHSGDYVKVLMTTENISDDMLEAFRNMEIFAEEGSKTPSKRLRDRLFIYWKQNEIEAEFEGWYRQRMENIIEKIPLK